MTHYTIFGGLSINHLTFKGGFEISANPYNDGSPSDLVQIDMDNGTHLSVAEFHFNVYSAENRQA